MKKSEWVGVCSSSDRDKKAVASWFAGMIDGYEIIRADTLSDIETDRTKKLRVYVRTPDGREKIATRTFGRSFTISLKDAPSEKEG